MATSALAALQEPVAPPTQTEPQAPPAQPQAPPQAPPAPAGQQVPKMESQGSTEGETADPKTLKKIDSYVTILMNELHGPDTRDDVLEILKSSPDPYMTIPEAALAVNDMAADKVRQGGGRLDLNTQFHASQYLVSDLMELGNTFGLFQVKPEEFGELYEDSLQNYIERGLKDGTIDPIELQLTGEKFASENQKIAGQTMAQEHGLPPEPQQQQVLKQVEDRAVQRTKADMARQQSAQAQQEQSTQQRAALAQAQAPQEG